MTELLFLFTSFSSGLFLFTKSFVLVETSEQCEWVPLILLRSFVTKSKAFVRIYFKKLE